MVLLAAMSALAPLSLQIFVPALPAIQASFRGDAGLAQLALSLSILANAVAALELRSLVRPVRPAAGGDRGPR